MDDTLDQLAAAFTALTLSKPAWTHAAHLRVGAWHVHHLGAERALETLRPGIRRLNESHGVANTASGGYHETITVTDRPMRSAWDRPSGSSRDRPSRAS